MAVLAIAIIFLCLSTVSAAEDHADANLTVDDNSLEVSELNEETTIDDAVTEDGNVNELKENEVLGSSDEDKLDATVYTTLSPVSGYTTVDGVITATVNVPIYVKMSGEYDQAYSAPDSGTSVYIRPNQYSYENILPSTTYGVATSNDGAPLTFTSTGSYTFIFKVPGSNWDIYSSSMIVNVVEGGTTPATPAETEISFTLPETATNGTSFDITYGVYEKGTTTEVKEGSLIFYDDNGAISDSIDLSTATGTFSYAYAAPGTYNIYANYTGTGNYADSSSSTRSITVSKSDEGEEPLSQDITLTVTSGSTALGGYLYPYTDDMAWIRVQGGNYGDATYVNFLVDFGINSQSSSVIQYKKSTDTTWNELSFTGNAPSLKFHNGKHDSDVITWAGGNTYDVRISNGDKQSNVVQVKCIQCGNNVNSFEFLPDDADEGSEVTPTITATGSSGAISNYLVSFFSSEEKTADSKLGTVSQNGGSITLPLVDSTTQFNLYYVFIAESGQYDIDYVTITVHDVASGTDKIVPEIQITAKGNETDIDQPHNITVTSDVAGKITLSGDNGIYDLGSEIPLAGLSEGSNTITVTFTPDDSENYETVSKTIIFVIESKAPQSLETTITLVLNTTEVAYNGMILITPVVVDENGNAVIVGNVEIRDDYSNYWKTTAGAGVNLTDTSYSIYNNPYKLYATYYGVTTDEAVYAQSTTSQAAVFYHVQSNTLTLTANDENEITVYKGQGVSIKAFVNGDGVISLSLNGAFNQTLTKETETFFNLDVGDYVFSANYTMSTSDYYASCESNSVTVHVLDITQPVLEITLDKTSVSNGEVITVTPSVIGASEGKGTVTFYDENDNPLGSIDLNVNTTFAYVASGDAGNHTIWAKYVDVNTATADSTRKDYKIKGTLTIQLTRNGDGLIMPGDSVEFTVTYSAEVSDNLELWVNSAKIGDEDGTGTTAVTFDDDDIGENNVYIKFLGNDDYEACESNNVTVNVIKPLDTNVTITLNPDEVVAGQNITITSAVVDENGNTVTAGIVNIYNTPYYTYADPVASVNAGESVNYTVPDAYVGTTVYLYGVFNGAEGDNAVYNPSGVSDGVTYTVISQTPVKKDISLIVSVDEEVDEDDYYEDDWTVTFEILTVASPESDGVIIYKIGETEIGRSAIGEKFELNASTLGLGEHNITAVFEGNESYNPANYTFTINVVKKLIWYTLRIDNVTYPDHAVAKLYATDVEGNYTITINGTPYVVEFIWEDVDVPVSFNISQLPVGIYTPTSIVFEDMEHYEFAETEIVGLNVLPTFEVKSADVELNGTVLTVSNGTAPVFSIDLANASGNLTVKVANNTYTSELKDGKASVEITGLDAGNYTAVVTYSGDDNHKQSIVEAKFTVSEKAVPDVDSTFNVDSGSTNPVFTINLPNATGNLTVEIANKTYTKELVNGTASIAVSDLNPGSYNAVVSYSGDKNYAPVSKNTTVSIPAPVLKGSNVNAVYSSSATYKVLVTVGGKALAGEKVIIKFNGKTYTRTTDKNGYASLKLATGLKVKSYNIDVEYKGVKTTNKLTLKHLIKAKNINVKKSKKVNKIKIKTNKVNKKYLKGKKLTLKIKGKKFKAKINKKGVATFKVKKSALKKLKVGKKYKYTVSYGKDKVTKKIKIKK